MTETTPIAEAPAAPAVPALKAILARKVGMTRIFDARGRAVPVTVLEAGPCPIVQVKTKEREGYDAVQLGFGAVKEKNVDAATLGHFKKHNLSPLRWLEEVRLKSPEGFLAGQEIRVSQFTAGDRVDVTGTSKGKGFAGVVKRHRFRGGPKTHGQSDRWRAPGSSSGQGTQNVFKGKRGPGHMGVDRVTVQRVEVAAVDAEKNWLLLRGSVPGPDGAHVMVRRTTRPRVVKKAAALPAAKKAAAKAPAKTPAKPEKK
jgi:large subunit ribosomal protein L3